MYKYHLRPGYGSESLLIEIFNGAERPEFLADFKEAIKELKPDVVDVRDFRMNDVIMLNVTCEIGSFLLSLDMDGPGFAFLIADDNQECLSAIDALLNVSEKFEKAEVDFKKYR